MHHMNGISVYKGGTSPSLSRQTCELFSAFNVHGQAFPNIPHPYTAYYRLIPPNTTHFFRKMPTRNKHNMTSKLLIKG